MEPFSIWLMKEILQFSFLIGVGGLISMLYSHLQKDRELRLEIINEFIQIHSSFYSIRKKLHNINEDDYPHLDVSEKKSYYHDLFGQCCDLEGRYRALITLIKSHFRKTNLDRDLDELEEKYEDWRHAIEEGARRINEKMEEDADHLYNKILHELERRISKLW